MAEQFTKFDSAVYLRTEGDVQAYLEACAEEAGDDPAMLVHALATVARAEHGADARSSLVPVKTRVGKEKAPSVPAAEAGVRAPSAPSRSGPSRV